MIISRTELPEVLLIEPRVFRDARGWFFESWSRERYLEHGLPRDFVQDNVSESSAGVLRGLHLQSPRAQAKLISVLAGEVFDVAVDVRVGSPTFGRWAGVSLSAANHRQLFVPAGFAHGFLVTGEAATVCYKCDAYYAPDEEITVRWDDPDVGIAWPRSSPVLSAKDLAGLRLRDIPRDRLPLYRL